MQEKHYRSVLKAITWRVGGTLLTIALTFMLTRRIDVSFSLGLLDLIVKLGGYYVHERIWNKIQYGIEKEKVPNGMH